MFTALPHLTTTPWDHLLKICGKQKFNTKTKRQQVIRNSYKNIRWKTGCTQTSQWYFARFLNTRQKQKILTSLHTGYRYCWNIYGASKAYKIQQLKSKFQVMSQGHYMLVWVTHMMLTYIKWRIASNQLWTSSIWWPNIIQDYFQISEQRDIFEESVTITTNDIQLL